MIQEPSSSPAGGIHEPSQPPPQSAPGPNGPDQLESQSVAGEEDPGASLDMAGGPSSGRPSGSNPVSMPSGGMNPGDEAPEGTPGTGEDLCPECGGSGRVGDAECVACGGTGKVIVGIGGA